MPYVFVCYQNRWHPSERQRLQEHERWVHDLMSDVLPSGQFKLNSLRTGAASDKMAQAGQQNEGKDEDGKKGEGKDEDGKKSEGKVEAA